MRVEGKLVKDKFKMNEYISDKHIKNNYVNRKCLMQVLLFHSILWKDRGMQSQKLVWHSQFLEMTSVQSL